MILIRLYCTHHGPSCFLCFVLIVLGRILSFIHSPVILIVCTALITMFRPPENMTAQQKIFVNDYELPVSPTSSPSDIGPPRKCYSTAGRSKSLKMVTNSNNVCNSRGGSVWNPDYMSREHAAASAYLQMPASIPLHQKSKDHVQVL